MHVLEHHGKYISGIKIINISEIHYEPLLKLFQNIHKLSSKVLIIWFRDDTGCINIYILLVDSSLQVLSYIKALLETLDSLRSFQYKPIDIRDVEYIHKFLQELNLRYCIVGTLRSIVTRYEKGLIMLKPISNEDLTQRLNSLRKAMELILTYSQDSKCARTYEKSLRKIEKEIRRLERGYVSNTWIGIILVDSPIQYVEKTFTDTRYVRFMRIDNDNRLLEIVKRLDIPMDLALDPDMMYILSPRYLTYLSSNDICELIIPSSSVQYKYCEENSIDLGSIVDLNLNEISRMCINLEELDNIGIFGAAKSGKTTTAQRIVIEFTKSGGKALIIDWDLSWRMFSNIISNIRKTTIYEISQNLANRLRWNPLRPPIGVNWKFWLDKFSKWFSICYKLDTHQLNIIRDVLHELYTESLKHNKYPTIVDLYNKILAKYKDSDKDLRKDLDLILSKLWNYTRGVMSGVFDKDYDITTVDMLESSDIVSIELAELDYQDRIFITGMLIFQLYYTCYMNRMSLSTPLMVVLEDAHRIFREYDDYSKYVIENLWSEIFEKSKVYNIYITVTSQTIHTLPSWILNNIKIYIIHTVQLPDDVEKIRKLLGVDKTILNILPKLPSGYAIVKILPRDVHLVRIRASE